MDSVGIDVDSIYWKKYYIIGKRFRKIFMVSLIDQIYSKFIIRYMDIL